jgi:hypothetical protein
VKTGQPATGNYEFGRRKEEMGMKNVSKPALFEIPPCILEVNEFARKARADP